MEIGVLLRLAVLMNHITNQYSREKTQWRRSCFLSLHLDICKLTSFRLCVVKDTTKLYNLVLVGMTFICSQGHSCVRKQTLQHSFSHTFLREVTATKSCKYGKCGSFAFLLLCLFYMSLQNNTTNNNNKIIECKWYCYSCQLRHAWSDQAGWGNLHSRGFLAVRPDLPRP